LDIPTEPDWTVESIGQAVEIITHLGSLLHGKGNIRQNIPHRTLGFVDIFLSISGDNALA